MEEKIEMDLFHDAAVVLRHETALLGCKVPVTKDDELACLYYYELVGRFPKQRPRRILRATDFRCPAEHQAGLEKLEEVIRAGGDIRPYLNKESLDFDRTDGLLIDWGIHHMHIGVLPDKRDSSFVERTGPLLHVRFTDDCAYFIAILGHGNWTNTDLIRIIHRDWPESIAQYKMKDVVGLSREITNDCRSSSRRAGINSPIEIQSGVVCSPSGKKFTCSKRRKLGGHGEFSSSTVRQVDEDVEFFRRSEGAIRGGYEEWRHEACDPNGTFHFRLERNESGVFAVDINQNIAIRLK
ncbi:MAG TPA: hypothetical protein PKI32_08320 [Opitutales bacterium]|nr:hypothetical protein [Opitutales bacterium]